MLLRVGISFLFGLFAMTLIYYLFPEIALGRGEFSLTFGIAFVGVLLLRFVFFQASRPRAGSSVGYWCWAWAGKAARLENCGCKIISDLRSSGVHAGSRGRSSSGCRTSRMLQVTGNLIDLAEGSVASMRSWWRWMTGVRVSPSTKS
ncbi:MAG: hypothetical protein U5O69_09420 [Candidatus Competibacteraceae bacterium]|nr:hypothetical protein [Candidatus Competibacteraceae bacterium]